uniref:Uncharacterized protein n=1 Tax=Phage sp. ctGns7 TaxID=2828003 RepID=A0A8S5S914_9VIRU|nr:MAG TPA: hypothetical protein [Phage sp. ctGns7]
MINIKQCNFAFKSRGKTLLFLHIVGGFYTLPHFYR